MKKTDKEYGACMHHDGMGFFWLRIEIRKNGYAISCSYIEFLCFYAQTHTGKIFDFGEGGFWYVAD